MTKVGWLIDGEMFDAYRDELIKCIRDAGHGVHITRPPSPPFRWDDAGCSYRDAYPVGACVVAHGDIELVMRVGRERQWTPGVFATIERFACSSYFCHFGEYLLNRPYVMLPFGDMRRSKEFLFETVGREGRIFVRPDSPLKLFTGQLATFETLDADLELMGFYEFPQRELVVVSPPQTIETEWRFVVVSRRVVGGSQYKHRDKIEIKPEIDSAALELAQSIAAGEYQPDPAWVIDICRTSNGEYRLLEIGGFSFADLYACDKRAVVEAVSAVAVEAWELGQK